MSQVLPQAVLPGESGGFPTAERFMSEQGRNDSAWSCNET